MYDWVQHDPVKDHKYCSICRQYPDLAEKKNNLLFAGTGGICRYRKQTLQAHNTSHEHDLCVKRQKLLATPGPLEVVVTNLTNKLDQGHTNN